MTCRENSKNLNIMEINNVNAEKFSKLVICLNQIKKLEAMQKDDPTDERFQILKEKINILSDELDMPALNIIHTLMLHPEEILNCLENAC